MSWKFGKNIAYYESQKGHNLALLAKFLTKSAFFDERKMTFLATKSLGA